jgi:hypothetical protein
MCTVTGEPFGLLFWFTITTSLVVTTVSFYNVLWPSHVVSRSGPGSSALILGSSVIWSSLIYIASSLDLLLLSACWPAYCDLVFADLCWSLLLLLSAYWSAFCDLAFSDLYCSLLGFAAFICLLTCLLWSGLRWSVLVPPAAFISCWSAFCDLSSVVFLFCCPWLALRTTRHLLEVFRFPC